MRSGATPGRRSTPPLAPRASGRPPRAHLTGMRNGDPWRGAARRLRGRRRADRPEPTLPWCSRLSARGATMQVVAGPQPRCSGSAAPGLGVRHTTTRLRSSVARELFDRVPAGTGLTVASVHARKRLERGDRVCAHRVAHVAALERRREEGRERGNPSAQLERLSSRQGQHCSQRGAVGLEAARVLFSLARHLAAVTVRSAPRGADPA